MPIVHVSLFNLGVKFSLNNKLEMSNQLIKDIAAVLPASQLHCLLSHHFAVWIQGFLTSIRFVIPGHCICSLRAHLSLGIR